MEILSNIKISKLLTNHHYSINSVTTTMIKYFQNPLKKENNKIVSILLFLVAFLPASLLTPSGILNAWSVLISALFITHIFQEKEYKIFNNNFFHILVFFWGSLIINLFFTSNLDGSILRALGFGKFIIFVYAIKYIISFKKFKYESFIYKIWFVIFCTVTFDLIFQYTFGFNTLGFKSPWSARLSGFLNQELKIGLYYYAFAFLAIGYCMTIIKKINIIYFLIIFFFITSFLIGERSSFIKMSLITFLFFLISFGLKNIFKKITVLIVCILITILTIYKSEDFKLRYYGQVAKPIFSQGILGYVNQTQYGAHYRTAIKIFKNYPYFGVGLKNFRNESPKDEYIDGTKHNNLRVSTHPHQIHLEFLSETGIFGYFSFLIFIVYSLTVSIKNYLISRNKYQLASILFVIINLLPLIPTGSFFTSYAATVFWINYAIMISYQKK